MSRKSPDGFISNPGFILFKYLLSCFLLCLLTLESTGHWEKILKKCSSFRICWRKDLKNRRRISFKLWLRKVRCLLDMILKMRSRWRYLGMMPLGRNILIYGRRRIMMIFYIIWSMRFWTILILGAIYFWWFTCLQLQKIH